MLIHTDKLRWLVWLRWKLLIRGYKRSSGRVTTIIGSIVLLLAVLVFGSSLAVGTFFGYRFLPTPFNSEILFLVLTGVYLLWLIAPIMQSSTNEGLDISKLELFPLTRAELMASLLLSTLLDTSTLFVILLFGAVVAGWAISVPVALMALLTMLVFYVQIIGMSQLVIALLSRLLHSRRLRDLSVILIVLFSASGYLIQLAVRGAVGAGFIDAMRNDVFAQYLQWLPPGMAARAIQQAALGNWGVAFVWLVVLLIVSVLVLYLWQVVMARALTSPESGGVQRVRQRVALARNVETQENWLSRLLSSQAVNIAIKDLKYFRRDPQMSALILQSLISMGFLVVITLFNPGSNLGGLARGNPWIVMVTPVYVTLSLFALSYNMLGTERQGLTLLFLFPVKPRNILWGKNLVVGLLGLIEITLIILLVAFFMQGWSYVLPAYAIGLACLGIILSCGNFTSVFLPQKMRLGRRFQTTQTSAEAGCLRTLMSMLMLVVMLLLLLPVAAAVILPLIFQALWVWSISIPASMLYGLGLYYIITILVAPRILERAPEILAVVTKE